MDAHTGEYIVIFMYGPLRENPDVEDGLCTMSVDYNESTGYYEFFQGQWIQHDTYVMADLKNVVIQNGVFLGDVYGTVANFLFTEYGDAGDISLVRYTPSFES